MKTVKRPIEGAKWTLSTKWIGPYESAFCILHKFAWQNAIDWAAFVSRTVVEPAKGDQPFWLERMLGSSDKIATYTPEVVAPYVIKEDFVDDTWFKEFARYYCFSLSVDEHLFSPKGGPLTWGLMQRYSARFCPSCLTHGYHTYLFQIGAMKCCPIHGDELISTCRMCGNDAFEYSLSKDSTFRRGDPLHCQWCNKPPTGKLQISKFFDCADFHQSARSTFGPLHDWLVDLSRYRPRAEEAMYAVNNVLKYAENFGQKVGNEHVFALQLAEKIRQFPLNRSLLFEQRRPEAIELKKFFPDQRADLGESALVSRVAIYKSIKRQLVKKIGQHRRCMGGELELTYRPFQGGRSHALLDLNMCPVANAIALWRMAYEAHLLPPIHDRIPLIKYRSLSNEIKYRVDELLPSAKTGDREWANSVISSFYARCMVLADFAREVMNKPVDERTSKVWEEPAYFPNFFVNAVLNVQMPPHRFDTVVVDGPSISNRREIGMLVFTKTLFAELDGISHIRRESFEYRKFRTHPRRLSRQREASPLSKR